MTAPDVRLGLCGWTIDAETYYREFRLLEVQQTFYQPPEDATLVRWRRRAPPGFEFTLKAWQLVTHDPSSPTYRRLRHAPPDVDLSEAGSFRWTPVVQAAWARTLECTRLLRATAILLQCPRSFRPSTDNVARLRCFAGEAERPAGVRLLWEPRGPWDPALVADLCAELDLVHVVDPLVTAPADPDTVYFRLHGVTGARHVHTDAELERVAAMLPRAGGPAYVLFNNLPRVGDARRFRALIAATPAG